MTNLEIQNAYMGSDQVDKIYLGSTLVYSAGTGPVPPEPPEPVYSAMPLTFEITSPGNIVWKASNTANTRTIEYSKNDGEWTEITSATGDSAPTISVISGDTVQFRGDNATYILSRTQYNSFSGTTCQFRLKGNIMSLIDSTGFITATTLESGYTFYRMFYSCTGLTDASNLVLPATTLATSCYTRMFASCTALTLAPALPATTLAQSCYAGMFRSCTSLTTAPELPVTTLANNCYADMFNGCTSLTTAPELPATTLASYCYYSMFEGCTGITTAPSLSATTLASYCYQNMFYGCTNLITAPELPATTLAEACYTGMFRNCTSLTTAPELPATILTQSCYYNMFSGCTNLNYVKCLATQFSSNCLTNWLTDVSPTGTFVKDPNATWPSGASGIPTGWTVQDADV